MKGRHETLGVLYLDTAIAPREALDGPLIPSRFTEDHLKLAIAIAHQAALAVEDTRYHQAMVQAERLAAIGQAIAALSHHIKNILQGLKSGSEVLKLGLQDKDEAMLQQGWKIVEKNQGKIYDLVMDMLGYSKERTSPPLAIDQSQRTLYATCSSCKLVGAKELNAVLEPNARRPACPKGIDRPRGNSSSAAECGRERLGRGRRPPETQSCGQHRTGRDGMDSVRVVARQRARYSRRRSSPTSSNHL